MNKQTKNANPQLKTTSTTAPTQIEGGRPTRLFKNAPPGTLPGSEQQDPALAVFYQLGFPRNTGAPRRRAALNW